ncbi:MAG TPA: hypothetical protein VGQ09_05025 [Chitinophagaceae bacterium]|jgi:hypothetical protein|nr:hypothetical protein [Chitinophagaceae bacterium]
MNGMMTNWIVAWGDYTQTGTLEFPPQWTHAFITLSKTGGDGDADAFFTKFRHRLVSGADQSEKLNEATEFAHDKVTSLTFKVWTFDAYGYATIVVTFW